MLTALGALPLWARVLLPALVYLAVLFTAGLLAERSGSPLPGVVVLQLIAPVCWAVGGLVVL